MNRNQATALVMYLQRAHGIIPTTAAEWSVVSGAISLIESVANGLVELEIKVPGGFDPPPAPEKPARTRKRD